MAAWILLGGSGDADTGPRRPRPLRGVGRAREPSTKACAASRPAPRAVGPTTPGQLHLRERHGDGPARVPGRRVVRPDGHGGRVRWSSLGVCQGLPSTWAVGADRPTAQSSAVQLVVRCVEPDPDAEAVEVPVPPVVGTHPKVSRSSGEPGTPGVSWVNSCPPVAVSPPADPGNTLTAPASMAARTRSPQERRRPGRRSRRG